MHFLQLFSIMFYKSLKGVKLVYSIIQIYFYTFINIFYPTSYIKYTYTPKRSNVKISNYNVALVYVSTDFQLCEFCCFVITCIYI